MYFLDTSVLYKSYIREKGSETVHEAFRLLDGSLFVSDAVALETLGRLTKGLRTKEISPGTYARARRLLITDMATRFAIVPVETPLTVALGHVHQYRTISPGPLDHLHLATVEYLQSLRPTETAWLFTSDRDLKKLAAKRGVEVFDPERDDLKMLEPPLLQ